MMFSINAMCLLLIFIVCNVTALNNKTCETPNSPENGYVIISKVDTTLAVYSCNSGYKMTGQAHIVCANNGEWDGRTPSCLLETKELSSHMKLSNAVIGGTVGGSALLGLAAVAVVYLFKKRNDGNGGPSVNLNCNCCTSTRHTNDNKNINQNHSDIIANAYSEPCNIARYGDWNHGNHPTQLSLQDSNPDEYEPVNLECSDDSEYETAGSNCGSV